MPTPEKIRLVYDHDCPVCRFYASHLDLSNGELELVDARKPGQLMAEISAAGIDIDAGLALKTGDALLLGSDAIHELATRSSGKGLFNRLTAWLFRSPQRARAFYPPLIGGRNLLLKVLGKTRINNSGKSNESRF